MNTVEKTIAAALARFQDDADAGASVGDDVVAIRETAGSLTRQVSEITASLPNRAEGPQEPEQAEK